MRFKKIYVEITNMCNKNCSFCPTTLRKKREMTKEEFGIVIDKIKSYTNYVYLHIKGEPLLHSEFSNIIKKCNNENIKINITTNGTLIEKRKEILKKPIINQINVSFHSYDDVEEIKNIINSCDEILQNNTNVNIVYRFWTFSKENEKFKNLVTLLCNHYNITDQKDDLLNLMNVKLKDRLYFNKDFEFEWPSLNNNIQKNEGFCYGLKTHIGILSDGTVVPCCLDQDGIINLGNIFEENLKDILENKKTIKIIEGFKQNKRIEKLCQHCSFKKL